MICDYGCGRKANHQFKNGKWCCEETFYKCPSFKDHLKSISTIGKIKGNPIITDKTCDYGCGNIAKYQFKNGKLCCSETYLGCSFFHKKTRNLSKPVKITTEEICSFGCGRKAKYILPTSKKLCFSRNWGACPEIKRKNSKLNKIKQSGPNNSRYGIKLSSETRRKIRLGNIKDLKNKLGQIFPNYNKNACKIIDEYGKRNGYNFQHAENGGEFFIKELGYWVDGYDQEKNVVIEVDELFHFDIDGNLKERDVVRQKEIKNHLNCEFIRIKNL